MITDHQKAVAESICRDARERDSAGAAWWDRERLPEVLETLRNALSKESKVRAAETPREPGKLVFDGHKFDRRPIDDDKESSPIVWSGRIEAKRSTLAERTLRELVREETGGPAGEKFTKQKRERLELLAQSHQIAQRLEAAGVPAYRHDDTSLWVYWICSDQWEELAKFRRIMFSPAVAAQVRSSKLAALEFFLQRNPFCRFWTFTSGPRVGLDELRDRITWLHSKLNELNKILRRQFSVEIIFRSTELGSVEFDESGNGLAEAKSGRIETDENGNPLFHPHAHCVVQSLVGFIHPAVWSKMFEAIWDFWRDDEGKPLNWDGGRKGQSGVIRNARECCKYVTKPGDMLRLTGDNLKRTHQALTGLKLVQPLGELKKEISNRKKEKKRLIRQNTSEGCVWKECFCWNKHGPESESEREFAQNLKESKTMLSETLAAARCVPGQSPVDTNEKPAWCRVFSRMAPAVGPRLVKEPRAIVGGNVFDQASVRGHPLIFKLWSEAIQPWIQGIAAEAAAVQAEVDSIRVHTVTPTGKKSTEWYVDPPPDESWETAETVQIA